MKVFLSISLIFSFLLTRQAAAQPAGNDTVRIEQVADNIYVLFLGFAGNVGVLRSADGFILVDNHFSANSDKIMAAVERLGRVGEGQATGSATAQSLPVKYVINTHWHGDHSEGNENFTKKGSVIVSHENSRQRLTTDQFIELFNMKAPARPFEGLPSVTFMQDMKFHERGETIHVFHVPNAHTDGDAIVHFQTSNVLHTGDVFIRQGLPFVDAPHGGSVAGIVAACERLLAICNDETKIIPGHGAVGKRQDVADYLQMVKAVRDKVAEGIRQGKTVEQLVAEKPGGAFFTSDNFVRVAYRELKK